MLIPNWTVPGNIKAICFIKDEVESWPQHLPATPALLKQVHGKQVVRLPLSEPSPHEADGCYTQIKNTICMVKTADCLPIFLCDSQGTEVAVLHGGWRGLAADIIKAGLEQFKANPKDIIAWLGPAICQEHYEIGPEVYEVFIALNPSFKQYFQANRPGHYLLDITGIAKQRLQDLGVGVIGGGGFCTFHEEEHFYSYRRDGKGTQHMRHAIWINE